MAGRESLAPVAGRPFVALRSRDSTQSSEGPAMQGGTGGGRRHDPGLDSDDRARRRCPSSLEYRDALNATVSRAATALRCLSDSYSLLYAYANVGAAARRNSGGRDSVDPIPYADDQSQRLALLASEISPNFFCLVCSARWWQKYRSVSFWSQWSCDVHATHCKLQTTPTKRHKLKTLSPLCPATATAAARFVAVVSGLGMRPGVPRSHY